MLLGALSSGLGGALIFLAIATALTGLYVLVTGRRSWAWLPAQRKAGAIALAVSFALLIAGGLTVPRTSSADLEAATAADTAKDASATEGPARSAAPSPSPVPSATASAQPSGEPLDLDSPYALAAGAAAAAPNAQPAYATKAADLLATLPIKGRAPKTGYDRALFGQAWADVDRNGCDTRNDILARDLVDETFKPGTKNCVVATGILADKYTGMTILSI
jgi:hypothetical protein